MANKPKATEALTCMNCGAPIKSGFFCLKCQSGENDDVQSKDDGWRGSRFTGDAKKKRQKELLMEDIKTWSMRVLVVAVVAGVGFGGWALFGARIKNYIKNASVVTTPHDKYDPTKDPAADVDNMGKANGKPAFVKQHDK